MEALEICTNCQKSTPLCVCSQITPIKTRTHVLFLQHPQEPDKDLGSARIAHLALPNSTLKIGLSWRNLSAALGSEVDPKKWGVLYLGSARKESGRRENDDLYAVTKKGAKREDSAAVVGGLQGLVVLDGTWSQAKALWWRNAWLLKLNRLVLIPKDRSLYQRLRKEPRAECLSTLESVAAAVSIIERRGDVRDKLLVPFGALLSAYRGR